MPIYEYEPLHGDCDICRGRFETFQFVGDAHLEHCPTCGLEVKRVVSRALGKVASGFTFEKAAQRGFTSFRRTGKGRWEKIDGQGVDAIVGTPEDIEAVEREKSPSRTLDLT